MTVRPRFLDARVAWRLLCGCRGLDEPDDPILVPEAQLRAEWEVFGPELKAYWARACEGDADEGWPDPIKAGPSWSALVLDRDDVSDEEARRILDDLMGWEPAGSDGDARGA